MIDQARLSGDQKGISDFKLATVVGGPCPCADPLLCVKSACRKRCQLVECNALTDCDPAQACVQTSANIPVCVPAVGTGQDCTADSVCASGNKCLTTDPASGTGKCYPSCTVENAVCPYGTCNKPNAQQSCLFCY